MSLDVPQRKTYIKFAAEAMILQTDATLLRTIVSTGEDEFVRLAQDFFVGHGFKRDDFREVFAALREAVNAMPKTFTAKAM
jgi:hypothetical protein